MNRRRAVPRHRALSGIASAITLYASVVSAQSVCGEWTLVDPPVGATSAIVGVTAMSANDAWGLSTSLGTIHWDGAAWTQVPLPDLSGLGSAFSLDAIMSSPPAQVAVAGVVVTSTWTTEQMLLLWDGSDWDRVETVELVPNEMGAPRYGAPRAMDGVAPNDIWIVGTASGFGDGVNGAPVLTVHWDGSELTEVMTPGVGNRQNHLYGVATIAADDAWAVGYYNNTGDGGAFHAMTYHWDGSSWSHVWSPAEALDQTFLYDIVAIGPDDVWAAGDDPNGPLFMHWDGSAWTIVPSPATVGTIQKLAAIASDDIWAVDTPWAVPIRGKYYHWDGTEWSVVVPPDVPGATQVSRHGGLAAVGECDVWAVGSSYDGTVLGPLVERLQAGAGATSVSALESSATSVKVVPNPVRRSAQIRLSLPGAVPTGVQIYDVRGRRVRTLLAGPVRPDHITWNRRNDRGEIVPDGMYFVRIESSDGRVLTRKLTVVR